MIMGICHIEVAVSFTLAYLLAQYEDALVREVTPLMYAEFIHYMSIREGSLRQERRLQDTFAMSQKLCTAGHESERTCTYRRARSCARSASAREEEDDDEQPAEPNGCVRTVS